MRIHRLSDKEIDSLNIPIKKYEEDLKFKEFKEKTTELLGDGSLKYLKYLLALYVVIDLYSLTTPEKKNGFVKIMEKMGLNAETIKKIDKSLKLGLSGSYIIMLMLKKKTKDVQKEEIKN